jgi:hypothetical protein
MQFILFLDILAFICNCSGIISCAKTIHRQVTKADIFLLHVVTCAPLDANSLLPL